MLTFSDGGSGKVAAAVPPGRHYLTHRRLGDRWETGRIPFLIWEGRTTCGWSFSAGGSLSLAGRRWRGGGPRFATTELTTARPCRAGCGSPPGRSAEPSDPVRSLPLEFPLLDFSPASCPAMKLRGEVRWANLAAPVLDAGELLILCSRRSASTELGRGWSL